MVVFFRHLVLLDEEPKGRQTLRPATWARLSRAAGSFTSVVLTESAGTRTPDRTDPTRLPCVLTKATSLIIPPCLSSDSPPLMLHLLLLLFSCLHQHIKLPAPSSPPRTHIPPQTPPTFSPQLFPGTLAPRDSPLHPPAITSLSVLALCSPSSFSTF